VKEEPARQRLEPHLLLESVLSLEPLVAVLAVGEQEEERRLFQQLFPTVDPFVFR
jgi:hypothetical protein